MTAPIPVPRAAPGTPPAPRYPHIRVDLLDVDPAQYVTVVRVALQHGGATAGDVDDFLESATADGADVLTLAARYVAADWRALALVDLARHAEDMPGPVVYRRARAATSMTDDEFDTVLADFVDAQHMLDDLDAGTLNPAE